MRVVIAGTKRSRRQERSLLWENGRQRKGSRAFRLIPIIAPLPRLAEGRFCVVGGVFSPLQGEPLRLGEQIAD